MTKRIILISMLILCISSCIFAKDFDVMNYGAIADNKTDNTQAFQKALDAAFEVGGGVVNVPSGDYIFNGNLIIKSGVFLKGTFIAPPTNRNDHIAQQNKIMNGSVLAVFSGKNDPTGKPFITLEGSNNGVVGLAIYYPEWSQKTVPPIPYPPCIAGYVGDNQNVIDCLLLNPYEGMRFVGVGRVFIRNVAGYPIKRGLYIDQCYDISRVENCHFWPFGVSYVATDPYCEWINKNGVAFEFARTDWQYVFNTFCFGYGAGYKFSEDKSGGPNGNFVGLGADSCTNSVLVEAAQSPGLLFTNGEFVGRWSSSDSCPMDIKASATGKVSIVNSSFWGPINTSIRTNSKDAFLSVIGCHFEDWDVSNKGTAAITLNGGNAIIQGNTFSDKPSHIYIGKNVQSAIITGNIARDALNITNNIGARAQIALNKPGEPIASGDQIKNFILNIGVEKDSKYIKGFNPGENAGEFKTGGKKRWSSAKAQIILPVSKNTKYTATFDIYVPEYALMANAGIYLNGKNIMPIKKGGEQKLSAVINTGKSDKLTFEIKVKEWSPVKVMKNQSDGRIIGIGIREVKMISNPKSKIFSFNEMKYSN